MHTKPAVGEHDAHRARILEMSEKTVAMLRTVHDAFRTQDHSALAAAERLGREIHRQQEALMDTLVSEAEVPTT